MLRCINIDELEKISNDATEIKTKQGLMALIKLIPTIDIIQCKDCKYAILEGDLKICNHPSNNAWRITEDHYCGYGKRKEDGEHEYTMEEYMYGQDLGDPEDGSL